MLYYEYFVTFFYISLVLYVWLSIYQTYYLRIWFIIIIDRVIEIYANVVQKMDSVFETYLGPDGGLYTIEPDDIPKINTTVWILGKHYNPIQGKFIKTIIEF